MDFKNAVLKNCSCAKTPKAVEQAELERYGLRNVTLRSYQLEGLSWLAQRLKCGHGCILGDEMGLGKTLQVCLNHQRPTLILIAVGGWRPGRGEELVMVDACGGERVMMGV